MADRDNTNVCKNVVLNGNGGRVGICSYDESVMEGACDPSP